MSKTKSLSVNIVANLVNQVSAALFPLITFPYVSRVLRPEGLGRVSFAEATVSYFVMLATLGVPLYGIRASAKCRDDKRALSTLAVELFALSAITTATALAAFTAFMGFSHRASADPVLFWICALPLLVVPIGFNWLLGGLEEYVYFTVRTLGLRALVVVAVFLFVRTQEDFRIYALIGALNTAGAGLLNVVFLRKRISVRSADWRRLNVGRHVKPVLLVFALGSVVGIHSSLSKVMLGYMTSDAEVGFYSAADRVVGVVVVLVTSVGAVLLPRASYYIKCEKLGEYRRLTTTALRFTLFVSFPAAAGLLVSADPFMLLLSGSAFAPAVPLVQIMAVSVILKALGHFMSYQVLYSQEKEKLLLCSAALGALSHFVAGWLLIPRWHVMGAALSALIAETCITGVQVILSRSYSYFAWPVRSMFKYGMTALLMAVVVLWLNSWLVGTAFRLLVSIGVGAAFYVTAMWLLRDSMLSAIWSRLSAGVIAAGKIAGPGV